MNQDDNLLDLLAVLYKWKWKILLTSFIAAVIAAAASLMLSNYYQASTLFYAASPDLAQPSAVGQSQAKKYVYGNDNDVDRLFSIANSSKVLDHLAEKFDLYQHYDINKDDAKARHKLNLKFNKLYNTKKTKYDAVSLSVEDKDPIFAAQMANEARVKVETLTQTLVKQSQKKILDATYNSVQKKQKEYDILEDSLINIGSTYGIFSADAQAESFGTNLVEIEGKYLKSSGQLEFMKNNNLPKDSIDKVEAKTVGLKLQLESLNKKIEVFRKGYPTYKSLQRRIRDFGNVMNLDKEKMAQMKATYDAPITVLHLIESAETPVYKSRPKRSVLVVGIGALTFVLMSLWTILKYQIDKNNWREHFRNA